MDEKVGGSEGLRICQVAISQRVVRVRAKQTGVEVWI